MAKPLPHTKLQDALWQVHAQVNSDKVFLQLGPQCGRQNQLTFGMVHNQIARYGSLFARWQLGAGDRVLIASNDDGQLVTAVLACLHFNLSAAVVDAASTPAEMSHLVDLSKPRAALVDRDQLERWPLDPIANIACVTEQPDRDLSLFDKLLGTPPPPPTLPQLLADLEPAQLPRALSDDHEAYVLFTSGSTSRPKGVRISRRSLYAHAQTLIRQLDYDRDSRLLSVLPLSHTDGLVHGCLVPWLAGATALRPLRFEWSAATALLDAIADDKATHFIAVPSLLSLLERVASDAGHTRSSSASMRNDAFRFIISSASELNTPLWQRLRKTFSVPVINIYGLTETVVGGLYCGPDAQTFRMGTLGVPIDCQASVRSETGKDLAPGETGELWLRGDNLTMGYLETQGGSESPFSQDWFRTGDLVRVDPQGFYHLVGRKKSLVISGGRNIQPEEVCRVLLDHPQVAEAVVLGIESHTLGEALAACVVARAPGSISSVDLLAHCRRQLSAYKVPHSIAVVDQLPKTSSGKISMQKARALLATPTPQAEEPKAEPTEQAVIAIAAEVLQMPAVELRANTRAEDTVAWDSFNHLSFVLAMETRFQLEFSTAEVVAIKCIGDAQRLVAQKSQTHSSSSW